MKKLVLLLGMSISVLCVFGQLKVASNGNAAIQYNGTPLSSLSVGGEGSADHKVSVTSNGIGLNVTRTGDAGISGAWIYPIRGNNFVTGNYNFGVYGTATNPTAINQGRAIGVLGNAGNSTSGYNYGVLGYLIGAQNGAGVVGAIGGNSVYVDGQYAGWFQGNVRVTGLINGVTVGNSDIRFKKNIVELDGNTTLSKLLKLKPIEYNLKQLPLDAKPDTGKVYTQYDENSQVFLKKKYGLIAQDLQEIYPDLVYEDQAGYLSIDYVSIVPLLIQSIKELQQQVEAINTATQLKSAQSIGGESTSAVCSDIAVLYQNNPNPFSQSTEIKYYLPTSVSKASLYIYDMQGAQLKQINLTTRGNGSVTISASEFNAGMYLYALIADEKEIGVKRMILTK